ncbi:MAG: flagellar FliJ family protein [Opitutaceae bacterium]|nr:flagellar FliJ family protein [Opitutaceae bacterium]
MKRFHFSLRPVGVLRNHRKLQARDAFAASIQVFIQAEEALAQMRSRVLMFETALQTGRRGSFSAANEAEALAAYRHECAAEAAAEKELSAARELMQRRRAEYLDAHRQVEVLQRLEDKARAVHRLEINREEQAGFDEFAGRRRLKPHPIVSS